MYIYSYYTIHTRIGTYRYRSALPDVDITYYTAVNKIQSRGITRCLAATNTEFSLVLDTLQARIQIRLCVQCVQCVQYTLYTVQCVRCVYRNTFWITSALYILGCIY